MTELGQWSSATPQDAREWLRDVRARWWVAGSWALDLYLGRKTRHHADLDVGCFRADLGELRTALAGWELHVAQHGSLRRLAPGEGPGVQDHVLWCRPLGTQRWELEIMLEERDGADWVFRRDSTVRLEAEHLALRTEDGTPFLRPEVQLLYKAKGTRQKDVDDLRVLLPRLDHAAVEWLRGALQRAHPGHPWISVTDRAV